MNYSVSGVLVDHHPSVIKSVFPAEALSGLHRYYVSLKMEDINRILGAKRTQEFKKSLIYNVFPPAEKLPTHIQAEIWKRFWEDFREEFHKPVVSLWFYKDLEETQSEKNKNALIAHGFSHGIIEAFRHPEHTHLFRRVIEIIDDILLPDTPEESARSIRNNQLIVTSLLPMEELKATYLTDFFIADQRRKKKLLKLEDQKLDEMNETQLKFNWAYVVASKSFSNLYQEYGLSRQDLENIIKICNAQVNLFEIRGTENWNPREDEYLSSLPFLITVLVKGEKIANEDPKDRMEKVKEIISKPLNTGCLKILPFVRVPELKLEKSEGINVWKTWKLEHVLGAIQEGDLAQASLFDLSEFIVSSLIITRGRATELAYEILIPRSPKYEEHIHKIVMKIKFLLLKINPAFDYRLFPSQGYVIKAYKDFIFPKIVPKEVSEIKDKLNEEEDYREEIKKELEKYAKISKLEARMKSALNLLSSPKAPIDKKFKLMGII